MRTAALASSVGGGSVVLAPLQRLGGAIVLPAHKGTKDTAEGGDCGGGAKAVNPLLGDAAEAHGLDGAARSDRINGTFL